MKRDDDYLREVLFKLEEMDEIYVWVSQAITPGPEAAKFRYHIELLSDEGLTKHLEGAAYRMTSQGHDYLDAIRSDTSWKRIKDGSAKVGGMTLGMMKDLALAYLKQEAAEKLGVKF